MQEIFSPEAETSTVLRKADTTGKGRKGMRKVKTAAIQMQCDRAAGKNLEKAEKKIEKRQQKGANIIFAAGTF